MTFIENFDEIIKKLYGTNLKIIEYQLSRYIRLMEEYSKHFSENEIYFFSTPGRTELGGNHTDHNLGKVLAASIDLDTIAIVSKNNSNLIRFYSSEYADPFIVDLENLSKIETEEGTTNSLIRGIASRFIQLGYKIGGFDGVMTSDVLPGSGLSSSASIEVMIGSVFNSLFNDELVKNEKLAEIGQYSENNYFGKPCGLMDQMACAVGGIIAIDFKELENPTYKKIDFSLEQQKHKLLIVDTGGSHQDLTDEYASVPFEMKSVANYFGKNYCREIDPDDFIKNVKELRTKVGDRAVLRASHYFSENERVTMQIEALENDNLRAFLRLISESGNSSYKWLQNIFSTKNVDEQNISIALAFTEKYLSEKGIGACRVHGGGFAGTIQVFIPNEFVESYVDYIEKVFGKGKTFVLNIRSHGAVCLNNI